MNLKTIIDATLSESQLGELPKELQPAKLFVWKHDIETNKEWDDFINGQLTAHTEWLGKQDGIFNGMIDVTNLTFGNNAQSFWSMLTANEQVTIYTSKFIDLTGKFISIGTDIDNKYFAVSYELNNFTLKDKLKTKSFYGKIVLVNIQRFLENEFNDNAEAPVINIMNGKLNSKIKIPVFKENKTRETHDPNISNIEEGELTIKKAVAVEVLFPNPAILIGGGFDFISNAERNNSPTPNDNKKIAVKKATNMTKEFKPQRNLCILPTQWNIPAVDNYGFLHPNDKANAIKILLATQSLGSVANTGASTVDSAGILGKVTSGLISQSIGLAQKFTSDKGTLANSLAITPSFVSSDSDALKFFVQGDATGTNYFDSTGRMNLKRLRENYDNIELNQAHGEMAKYGKSMSPSNNAGFNNFNFYRALGMESLEQTRNIEKLPFLATPFGKAKIDETKIDELIRSGAPRLYVDGMGDMPRPLATPETWDVYIRNMYFRPDPYSFFNWACIMPAEIGTWTDQKKTSIAYDTSNAVVEGISAFIGGQESTQVFSQNDLKESYWNKTIEISKLTNNDFPDRNNTYSTYRFELEPTQTDELYMSQISAFTSSIVHYKFIGEDGKVIREQKMQSQGKVAGTSASYNTIHRF